jgi:hypothetical protein
MALFESNLGEALARDAVTAERERARLETARIIYQAAGYQAGLSAKERMQALLKLRKATMKGLGKDELRSIALELGFSDETLGPLMAELSASDGALFSRTFLGPVPGAWLGRDPTTGALLDPRDKDLHVLTVCADPAVPCDPADLQFLDPIDGTHSPKFVDQPNVIASMTFWYNSSDPSRTLTIDSVKVHDPFEGYGINTTMIRKVVQSLNPPPERIATDYLDMANAEKFYTTLLSGLKADPGARLIQTSKIPDSLKGLDHSALYEIFSSCCEHAFIPKAAPRDGSLVTPILDGPTHQQLESAIMATHAGQTRKSAGYAKICPGSMKWKWVPGEHAQNPTLQGKFKITFAACP